MDPFRWANQIYQHENVVYFFGDFSFSFRLGDRDRDLYFREERFFRRFGDLDLDLDLDSLEVLITSCLIVILIC